VGARPNPKAALEQAERDAQPDKIPVAVCRWDGEKDAIVSMRFSAFQRILASAWRAERMGLAVETFPALPAEEGDAGE
jgi:hypothetical protein